MLKSLTLAALLAVMATACFTATPEPDQSAIATAVAQEEAAPSQTPLAATATLTPTLQPTPTETPVLPTATPGPAAYGPVDYPAGVNPLTGLTVSDPTLLNRRPISIKVQIFPRGQRPPWGMTLADIVYDYYQNSGLTRFHAIFFSNDAERVGPIRSARLLDQHLVRMYKSFLAFGGADHRILRVFLESNFANRLILEGYGNCPPMCRVDPNGYNYLVANTAELSEYTIKKGIDNSPQDLSGMVFNETIPAQGQPANQAFIHFSISAYVRWEYDPASGKYLRFQDTREAHNESEEWLDPMIDGLTGQQVTADNVVVIYVAHATAFNTKPGSGNEIIDILLNGSALAYAFRDGQVYEVRWNRPATSSVLSLTYPDGQPFPFKPGQTWFEVIGQSSELKNPAADIWRFEFHMP